DPELPYEMQGVFDSCVFSNGLLVDDDGTLRVYYGAADRVCCGAVSTVDDMVLAAGQ
ncbi:MAG: glycosidase, partial [bacterium]|nr:glycosidase [bacterium]